MSPEPDGRDSSAEGAAIAIIRDGRPSGAALAVAEEFFQGKLLFQYDEEGNYCFFLNFSTLSNQELLLLRRILTFSLFAAVAAGGSLAVAHGALAEKDGRAILVAGDGGIGKSTCMRRLSSAWRIHGDDALALIRVGEALYAHPLPTWSRYFRSESDPSVFRCGDSVKLERIYLLSRGGDDRISDLNTAEKIAGLTGSLTHFHYIPALLHSPGEVREIRNAGFEFARRSCRLLPVRRFNVAFDGDFSGLLEDDMGFSSGMGGEWAG